MARTMVLKTFDGQFFKGFTTFGYEMTKKRNEAKRYKNENLEMLEDELALPILVFPAFYQTNEFVHRNGLKNLEV